MELAYIMPVLVDEIFINKRKNSILGQNHIMIIGGCPRMAIFPNLCVRLKF